MPQISLATIGFDMYGTVFDVGGLAGMLEALPAIGQAKQPMFNSMWRSKQLEYTFRRTVMDRYEPMTKCTRHAFDFCCDMFDADVPEKDRQELCDAYLRLPAFPDCNATLETLRERGHRCVAFSNGTRKDIVSLLTSAGLDKCFDDIVVVDDMPRPAFKPSPETYDFFITRAASFDTYDSGNTWLVSGNSFDIVGAAACGWKTAWIKRGTKPNYVLDPWPDAQGPTVTVTSFGELIDVIEAHSQKCVSDTASSFVSVSEV